MQKTVKSYNPWGDDQPEKLRNSGGNTIGARQQLKNLINPANMLDSMFGRMTPEAYRRFPQKEKFIRREEKLVFTYHERKEEQNVTRETKYLLDKLKEQVALLEKSEKALTSQIAKIKVEQLPKKSGVYHLRFFEWLLGVVKQLRMRVEEGRAWLATFTNRKKKKLGYWNMYKKHGTTFGLSHERTLATQTG